jgi:hypothetical protein
MLNVVILKVVILSVIRLNVVMLCVVAPLEDKLMPIEVQAMDRARKLKDQTDNMARLG